MTSVTPWSGRYPPAIVARLERLLGLATVGSSSPGEVFAALGRIRDEDPETWVKEFFDLAARLEGEAMESRRRGHLRTAAGDFRRATTYFRFAETCADASAPFVARFAARRRAAFLQALEGEGVTSVVAQSGSHMNCRSEAACVTPIAGSLLVFAAAGETFEDVYLSFVPVAFSRGFAVTLITGADRVDPDALGPWIASLRAGGLEPCDTGLIALEEGAGPALALSGLPWRAVAFDSPRFSAHPAPVAGSHPLETRWHAAREGSRTPEFRDTLLEKATRITAPALVLAGEAEDDAALTDAKALFACLPAKKQLHFFETELGAGTARQAGNPLHGANVLLDWMQNRQHQQ